jgi:hypothetical protein
VPAFLWWNTWKLGDYLPQVLLTLADTSVTLSLMSRDWPFFPSCVAQSGTMYQLLSPELPF